jgi:hypothetical protein
MPILLAQVPTNAVTVDDERYPDRDELHVLAHLMRYCSKFDPLPAITIVVEGDTAIVVRGHKYLKAAIQLGRATLRAVIASPPGEARVRKFLARPDVTVLDWESIKAAEEKEVTRLGWHIFYFERPLSSEEKRDFDERVSKLFPMPGGPVPVTHDDAGPLAEFQVQTPVQDEAAARAHHNVFAAFSSNRARIVTYQGMRFEVTSNP